MNFNDRTILVTGANRGIGKAIVDALRHEPVRRIYAGARNLDSLPEFDDARVVPISIDITDPASVANAAATATDVDLLVNNAGIATFGSILDAPLDAVEADMNVNYYGTLDMVRHFVPVLEGKRDPAIVNIVTIAAFVNFPIIGGYSASKAALFSLSQGIRIELAPRGINVHTVNPGPVDTDLASEFPMDKTSAEETARNILAGLRSDEADIFPDPASQQMFGVWRSNYRDLETAVYDMHHAA